VPIAKYNCNEMKDTMGRSYSMHGEKSNAYGIFVESQKDRDH
jgi:hypothetical protein